MTAQASAKLPEIRFVPGSWYDIKQGDRIVSRSGTVRTVLSMVAQDGKLALSFRTTRVNGEVEIETAQVLPHAVQGIKEVIRTEGVAHSPMQPTAPAPKPVRLPAISRITPSDWSEVTPGDVMVSFSGTRRLITGVARGGSELLLYCLMRTTDGHLEDSFLATAPDTIGAVQCVLRLDHPEQTDADGNRRNVPPGTLFNIETFLGRGDLGDSFVQTIFVAAGAVVGEDVTVELQAAVDPSTLEISGFYPAGFNIQGPPTVTFTVLLPGDEAKPLSITDIKPNGGISPDLLRELARCAALSNALKGVDE